MLRNPWRARSLIPKRRLAAREADTRSITPATRRISMSHFDAIVIGSGQGGTPLAKALASSKYRTALIEREHIGGCCVNEGCTPTKTMIASGRAAYIVRRSPEYGIQTGLSTSGQASDIYVAMENIRQRKRDIVDSFRSGSERGLRDAGVEVLMGSAHFVDEHRLNISLNTGEEHEIIGDRIFINTGERPAVPDLPGLRKADGKSPFADGVILDSTSVMELGEVPKHMVVVGGGYIGLEFGQLFRRLGARVTIVQRAGRLLPREDPEVVESLTSILKEDGIEIRLNCVPVAISPGKSKPDAVSLTIEQAKGEQDTLSASHILFAAGRVPNTDSLNLSAAGVTTTSRGHVEVNSHLQTSKSHIWALGDVKGGPAFTHISYDDFRLLNANLLQAKTPTSLNSIADRVVPYVVYTDPQLGHVGLHLEEAIQKYGKDKIKVATMPMAWVARALETDEKRGLMKAVVNADTEKILGYTCLGLEGGELMSIVHTAIIGGLSWKKLRDACFAHPTLAESLNNLWGSLQ